MADKRISQLNSHTTPSGSDLLVIVTNNETKKITYADLSSAITGSQTDISALNTFTQSIDSRVDNLESWSSSLDSTFATDLQVSIVSSSVAATIGIVSQNTGLVTTASFNEYTASQSTGSLVDRLNSIENATSSYELKGSGILSGSISYNDLTNIPSGIVSESTDLSSINTFTQSIDSRVDNLESWSSSLDDTFATDLQVSIVSSSVAATIGIISQNTGLVSTSSFNEYTASISTASLVSRLDDLESHTGSYLTSLNGTISGSSQLTGSYDERYVLSGSITQTTWDNISGKPVGLVSQSTDISSLNAFTASYFTDSSSFDSRITTEKGRIDAILSASTADADTFAEIVTLINSVDTTNDNAFATYYTSSNARISSLENVTSSYETKGRGIVSGSSQLTSSLDIRYATSASYLTSLNGALSSSTQVLGGTGIYSSSAQLPNGLISGSSQLTASYDTRYTLSGSVGSTPAGTISGSSQLTSSFDGRYVQTGSFNSFTASALTTGSNSFNGNQTITGSLIVSSVAVVNGAVTIPTGSTISLTSGSNLFIDSSGAITGSLTGSVFGIGDVSAFSSSVNTRLNNITSSVIPAGTISGSSQLTSSFDVRYLTIGGLGVVSGSTQLTSSFEVRGSGIYSSSAQLPSGLVSGSSQLPSGLVSGSSQLTSSYDSRYTLTSSFNSFTASAQAVTTGSNTFNGTQTITGSLNITNGNIVASQITANTASLYLTSGSNMYVQNNGLVEITGSLVVSGSVNIVTTSPLQIGTGSGDEGGEILLAKAATNSTLTGSGITIDSYRDRLRIFEQGGDARGVYIDLAKTPTGVSGELIWKASGMVNAGTFVTLDNIKATVTSSGNRGLSIAAVSTNFTANISAYYAMNGGMNGTSTNNFSVTTTPTTTLFTWNFTAEGDGAYYTIVDKTNNRMYRVTLMIGASYNNNFISIERLY